MAQLAEEFQLKRYVYFKFTTNDVFKKVKIISSAWDCVRKSKSKEIPEREV